MTLSTHIPPSTEKFPVLTRITCGAAGIAAVVTACALAVAWLAGCAGENGLPDEAAPGDVAAAKSPGRGAGRKAAAAPRREAGAEPGEQAPAAKSAKAPARKRAEAARSAPAEPKAEAKTEVAADSGAEGKAAPPRPAGKAQPAGKPAARKVIAALLDDLRADDQERVRLVFWRLAEIRKDFIPPLIDAVESKEPTNLTRIKIIVLDKDFVGHGMLLLANRLHGMGKMEEIEDMEIDGKGDLRYVSKEYTSISCGPKGKYYEVVMDRTGGFPLGIVIRAGLINRFKSTNYPSRSDDDPSPGKLTSWWREYYTRVKGDL